MSTNNLTIGTILTKTIPYLAEKGIPNPRLEADLMLAAVLDLPRVKLYSQWDRPLEPPEIQRFREMIIKRVQGTPMAYLIGKKSFLSWDFIVSPAVLIPRPETELLVEAVHDRVKGIPGIRGVDVGTGSGILAVSLAKLLPDSSWYAIDLSPAALEIARLNANNLGVADRVLLVEGDLLEPVLKAGLIFDVIVSNPPYIPEAEIKTLQPEVRKEPVMALDGGADGLNVYRRLIPQVPRCLDVNGWIAVEHGFNQSGPLKEIFKEAGLTGETLKDLAGFDRVMIGKKIATI